MKFSDHSNYTITFIQKKKNLKINVIVKPVDPTFHSESKKNKKIDPTLVDYRNVKIFLYKVFNDFFDPRYYKS